MALTFALIEASPARASCALPPLTIVWSSPAHGDTDVPLDADLLLILDGLRPGTVVRLADRVLTASAVPGVYDLGQLEPSKEYSVTVDAPGNTGFDGKPVGPRMLSFTTGTGSTQTGSAKSGFPIKGIEERIAPYDTGHDCRNVLWANSCYDTGPPILQTFDVDVDGDAALWVVETQDAATSTPRFFPRPAECGLPQQLMIPHGAADLRYVVHAVDANGSIVSSKPLSRRFDPSRLTNRSTMNTSEECAVSAPGSRSSRPLQCIAPLLTAFLLVTIRRRRQQSG